MAASTGTCSAFCTQMGTLWGYGSCIDSAPVMSASQATNVFATVLGLPAAMRTAANLAVSKAGTGNSGVYSVTTAAGYDGYGNVVTSTTLPTSMVFGPSSCSAPITATSGISAPGYQLITRTTMCGCGMGSVPALTPTVVTTANLTAGKSVFSAATDANGNIWFNTIGSTMAGATTYSNGYSVTVIDKQLWMVPSPSYALNVPTGITDCAYVWSNSSGSVFYFTSDGAIKLIV